MADFAVVDGTDFPNHFALTIIAPYAATPAETGLVRCVADILAKLVQQPAATGPLADEIAKLRSDYCKSLRDRSGRFIALAAGADRDRMALSLYDDILRNDGAYQDRYTRLMRVPFEVELEGDPATDLVIRTRDVPIPETKQALKVEIDQAATVVRAVLAPREATNGRGGRKASKHRRDSLKLQEYIGALAGIARVGLMNTDPSQVSFARLALNGFKDEFVAREAGLIKNAYVLRLGFSSAVAILVFLAALFIIENYVPVLMPQKNFLWMFMGAAAGAWLSFSIRRVVLNFGDLAVLEDDRLRPELRIVFVVVLTAVVGLIFWTGMVSISIGQFNTDFGGVIHRDTAILIGAFCGLAERTLSTAVAKRAKDFALGLGGSQPSAKK